MNQHDWEDWYREHPITGALLMAFIFLTLAFGVFLIVLWCLVVL